MDDNINSSKKHSSGENTFHLKMLIPSVAAGAIIGKGGETIAEIQKNVGARIKMSKPNDFYPGTNERICLITGGKDAIATIVHFLNTKIKEKPDPNAKPAIDFDNKIAAEREKQMKVIVPNSTAGMIIGKGGSYIKLLKEKSGAFIQLSQKSKETTLPERVITIIGDDDNLKEALDWILMKVVEDPQSGSCLNISYSEIQGPVANFNPTGSPFANGAQNKSEFNMHQIENEKEFEGFNLPMIGGGAMTLRLNFNPHIEPTDARLMTQCLGHINNSFKAKGYNDKVSDEVTKAFSILSMHGVLQVDMMVPQAPMALLPPGMPPAIAHENPGPVPHPSINNMIESQPGNQSGLAPPQHLHPNNHLPPPQQPQPHPSNLPNNQTITDSIRANMGLPPPPPTPPNQGPFGGLIHANHENGVDSPFKRPADGGGYGGGGGMMPVNNNSFGLATAGNPLPGLAPPPPPGMEEHLSKFDIEVNESLVGAVLGPAGRSIVEIQQFSGAQIQISKKGNYVPGTRNRIVTITGPQKSLTTAQFLIEQRVAEEEMKRKHNNQVNMGF